MQTQKATELIYRAKQLLPGNFRMGLRYQILRVANRLKIRRFLFAGEELHYLFHDYCASWNNERVVEIPIAKRFLDDYLPENVLEVGNVLGHYFNISHRVVDKYEKADGVENIDVVDIPTTEKYDLILSISTLEHVGFDEDRIEPEKILKAISVLRNMLTETGRLIVTLPLGYNPSLDAKIRDNGLPFDSIHYLKRVSALNAWKEVEKNDALACRYNYPYSAANGLLVGVLARNLKF